METSTSSMTNMNAAIKRAFGEDYRDTCIFFKITNRRLLVSGFNGTSDTNIISMQAGIVPPTINYEYPDDACDLNLVLTGIKKQKSTMYSRIHLSLRRA